MQVFMLQHCPKINHYAYVIICSLCNKLGTRKIEKKFILQNLFFLTYLILIATIALQWKHLVFIYYNNNWFAPLSSVINYCMSFLFFYIFIFYLLICLLPMQMKTDIFWMCEYLIHFYCSYLPNFQMSIIVYSCAKLWVVEDTNFFHSHISNTFFYYFAMEKS